MPEDEEMANDDNGEQVPEAVQEYAQDEIGEVVPEQEQFQPINRTHLRNAVRGAIDQAIQSGLEPDHVQETLQDLADGVPYFYDDAQRYNPPPEQEDDNE